MSATNMSNGQEPTQNEKSSDMEQLTACVRSVKLHKPGAISKLSSELDRHPGMIKLLGELSNVTRLEWAKLLSAGDPVVLTAICRCNRQRLVELLGENPTESERVMAEQVVLLELQLAYYERWEALNVEKGSDTSMMAWMSKRQDSVRHQFHLAVSRFKNAQLLEIELDKKRPAGSARLLRIFDPLGESKSKAG